MAINELHYLNTPDCHVELKDLELHHDKYGYYLSAKYKIEDNRSIRELNIPKIRLKLTHGSVRLRIDHDVFCDRVADIGFGWCDIWHDGYEVYFTETVIEEKTHEMTMEELEKLLGYKVKIVNKKE